MRQTIGVLKGEQRELEERIKTAEERCKAASGTHLVRANTALRALEEEHARLAKKISELMKGPVVALYPSRVLMRLPRR